MTDAPAPLDKPAIGDAVEEMPGTGGTPTSGGGIEQAANRPSKHTDEKNSVAKELLEATHQNIHLADSARRTSKSLSAESSSVIVGTLGGALGTGVGYGLSIKLVGVSMLFAGPIGFAIGAAGGILLYRGRKAIMRDREIENVRREAQTILDDIARLPPDVPEEIREKFWAEYERIRLGHKTIDITPEKKEF